MKKDAQNVIIDGNATIIKDKKRSKYRKGTYMLVNQIELAKILANKEIFTNEVIRVLLGLISVADYACGTDITQQKLAESISMQRPNVARCLKVLEQNDIIYRDGRSWYIDDKLAWKGIDHEINIEE